MHIYFLALVVMITRLRIPKLERPDPKGHRVLYNGGNFKTQQVKYFRVYYY